MPIRWELAAGHPAASWASVHGSPDRDGPISLAGQGDEIVDIFHRVPSGRLLVLGKAGAGKTILTSRFVLTLLDKRDPTGRKPVPVIFSIGSWDPRTCSLREWLRSQLTANHPMLAGRDRTGVSMAAHLISTGRVLPVLDGFDEIPENLRAKAIGVINTFMGHGHRLLLTSRPGEYDSAVRAGSQVFSRAAVIQLLDLTLDDITSYLPNTIGTSGTNKWDPILRRLHDSPGDPVVAALASVLRTPLMVALARIIYSDTGGDPADLLERRPWGSLERRYAIEEHLLARLVPAVYRDAPPDDQLAAARRWRREDASRWLSFLASSMNRRNTYDIAWWQLVHAVPRVVTGLAVGLVIALAVGAFVGVVGWFGGWPDSTRAAWFAAGIWCGPAIASGCGTTVAFGVTRRPEPSRMRLSTRGRSRQILGDVMRGLRSRKSVAWHAGWASTLTAIAAFLGGGNGIAVGLAGGLLIGLGIWLVGAVATALGIPVRLSETPSPVDLLRLDRRTALAQGIVFGLGGTVVAWPVVWLVFEPGSGLPFELVFGDVLWAALLLTFVVGLLSWLVLFTVWGSWLIARSWLPLRRKLPWRLMTFLADAHQLGVLRQAGGVYQFRHARLQDHLAAAPGPRT